MKRIIIAIAILPFATKAQERTPKLGDEYNNAMLQGVGVGVMSITDKGIKIKGIDGNVYTITGDISKIEKSVIMYKKQDTGLVWINWPKPKYNVVPN